MAEQWYEPDDGLLEANGDLMYMPDPDEDPRDPPEDGDQCRLERA